LEVIVRQIQALFLPFTLDTSRKGEQEEDSYSAVVIGREEEELIMMEGGSSGSEEGRNLNELLKESFDSSSEWSVRHAARLMIYNRIMKLSMEELKREAAWKAGEDDSVLHQAAGDLPLPVDAITRLCAAVPIDAITRLCAAVGIDCKDARGRTVIMHAAAYGYYDIVQYLARNKQADLSIKSKSGFNVYTIVGKAPGTSQEDKDNTYRVLRENGVTSATIIEGFRSSLSSIDDSLLLPKRLAQEDSVDRFYIRAMTLSMDELEEEAKERRDDEHGEHPIMFAARYEGMEEAMVRLQRACPGSVNATNRDGGTAIMQAAFNARVEHVRTLATMGTDLSLKHNGGDNVLEWAGRPETPTKIAEMIKVLAEHGVTSLNIPRGFQSPHYFRSIYYQDNVRTQRWTNRSPLILSVNYLYNWSVENQIEDQVHRTLPADLSGVGHFVAHCFFDVGGGRPDNGIARLITQYYGGFDESRAKSPFALIGMPKHGKLPDTAARCSACRAQAVTGKKWLRCCGKVGYCSKECQVVDWKKFGHKKSCERNVTNIGNNV
jgi:ankyrin repeat protein